MAKCGRYNHFFRDFKNGFQGLNFYKMVMGLECLTSLDSGHHSSVVMFPFPPLFFLSYSLFHLGLQEMAGAPSGEANVSGCGTSLVLFFPGTRRAEASTGNADAVGLFNSHALEGLEASSSILNVCCFVSIP